MELKKKLRLLKQSFKKLRKINCIKNIKFFLKNEKNRVIELFKHLFIYFSNKTLLSTFVNQP